MELRFDKYILAISFANLNDGKSGMAKYILAQKKEANKKSLGFIYLFAVKKMIKDTIFVCRFGMQIDDLFLGVFSIEQIIHFFKKNSIEIKNIYIHHFLYLRLKHVDYILKHLPNLPIYIFLHDYYLCCKNYFLYSDGAFCESKHLSQDECVNCSYYKKSMKLERKIHSLIYSYVDRVRFIAPSTCSKTIFLNFHPEYKNRVDVIAHQIISYSDLRNEFSKNKKIRIAFIGRNNEKKGWKEYETLVKRYSNDYEFYVINSYNETIDGAHFLLANFGQGKEKNMIDILETNNIDVVFIWAKWPETYSYVAYEAFAAKTYVITFKDSGNVADFVEKEKCGKVYSTFESLLKELDDNRKFNDLIYNYRVGINKKITIGDNIFIGSSAGNNCCWKVKIPNNRLKLINIFLTKYYLKKYFS